MYMNGAGTGMEITVVVRRVIHEGKIWALAVSIGVVAGAPMPVAAGLLFAVAVLATASSSLASA